MYFRAQSIVPQVSEVLFIFFQSFVFLFFRLHCFSSPELCPLTPQASKAAAFCHSELLADW